MARLTIGPQSRDIPNLKEDLYMSQEEAWVLLNFVSPENTNFKEVFFSSGTYNKAARQAIMRNLSKKNYVSGVIKKGETTWHLETPGAAAVIAIGEFIDAVMKERDSRKKEQQKLDFKQRVRAGYYRTDSKAASEFKGDLLEHFGVKDHPKVDKVYNLAYTYGHRGGYSEVMNYFSDLIELIK